MELAGKKILLGVSGSIAAYKAVDVLRRLMDRGAEVRIVMTRSAVRFITPLTFAAVSGRPTLTDEFRDSGWGTMGHITVTDDLDLALVAPATANVIGKIASGIADDALSTALLAASCPIILAPAMNSRMYANAIVQRNIGKLRDAGVRFVDPECGSLACGMSGPGRLATTDSIMTAVQEVLSRRRDLVGTSVLVTAGPTREAIDPVRFLSNASSGKMGHALAEEAHERGAEVVLISGPTHLAPPRGVAHVPVTTAAEMRREVLARAGQCHIVIMAAAVSDFRPRVTSVRKIKKETAEAVIALERTEDILQEIGAEKGTRILVGFAAETDNVIAHAMAKREGKNLDLIVANDITKPCAGFGSDTNVAVLIDKTGAVVELPLLTKRELAVKIIDRVMELKKNQGL